MVIPSRWSVDIPECSIHSWVFPSSFGALPNTPQFIDPERPDTHFLSLSDYRIWSKRVALGLRRAGLRTGDRVLLFSGNQLFTPVIFMGVMMAGGVFTGANPSFVARELEYQLKDSGASFLVAADSSMDIALEAAAKAGLPKDHVYAFDATGIDPPPAKAKARTDIGPRHWTELLVPVEDAEKFDWIEPADPKTTICCLNYSSGTTGVPKGVEITHYNYVANGVGIVHMLERQHDFEDWRKRSRQIGFLPLYHAYGQTFYTCNFHRLGIPCYIMHGFDFERMLRYIQQFRITSITAVPPIVVALAKHPIVKKYDLSSVESVTSGAAPLGKEISDEVVKLWPEGAVSVRQGWGMTELTCSAVSWDFMAVVQGSAAVGEMMPNCEARIVRPEDGSEVTTGGEPGEIWVSGPTLMKGYWNKPEATADTIVVDSDGKRWLKTGDIAYIEKYEPGELWHIVDRLKELIKVKGNQVAPAELEAVLYENKGVADAAVVGVTIDGEEYPRAYVVPTPGAKQTEKDIAAWMEGKVVHYKRLRGGVKFVDAIPKNPVSFIYILSMRIMKAGVRQNQSGHTHG